MLLMHTHPDPPPTALQPVAALQATTLKTWGGKQENWDKAQDILIKLAKANSEAQLGTYKGPHPVPGGGRILQQLRLGGAGK